MDLLNFRRIKYANRRGNKLPEQKNFNCWGATLFVLNQSPRLKWASCKEMNDFLKEFTEKIYRPRKVGDILAVNHWGLDHTAVYIGGGKYFHKRGSNTAEITDINGVKKIYGGEYTFHRLKSEALKLKKEAI